MSGAVIRRRPLMVLARWTSRRACQGRDVGRVNLRRPDQATSLRAAHTLARNNRYYRLSEEIRDAVMTNKPVVALETTIYTHGWPYPDNLGLARHLEDLVRSSGAVPATIGILNGVAIVGMAEREMKELMDPTSKAIKISRRDLAFATSQKISGGTTIASTMMLARRAGIKVFATGGLGGVHRGGENSMDVSADLTELGRSAAPIAVVAGGCKGFLDIPRTLEYLETQGAVVATFADDRVGPVDFPAFWVRDSGIKSPLTIKDEMEAAALLRTNSSVFFAGPVPEGAAISMPEMEEMIAHALRAADESGVHGSANTPFVLSKLKELSQGRSVIANRALVEANVKRGARTAVELRKLFTASNPNVQITYQPSLQTFPDEPSPNILAASSDQKDPLPDILVAGSIAVDTSATYTPFSGSSSPLQPVLQTSNPASISQTVGGVGYNLALAATFTHTPALLLTSVASDTPGKLVLSALQSQGLSTAGIHMLAPSSSNRTAQYLALNNANADLNIAMADMTILESSGPAVLASAQSHITALAARQKADGTTRWLIADANWSAPTLHSFLTSARDAGLATAFEPVSTAKAARLFDLSASSPARAGKTPLPQDSSSADSARPQLATLMSPNAMELSAMHRAAASAGLFERQDWWRCIDALGIPSSGLGAVLRHASSPALVDAGIPQQAIQLLPFVPTILTKLGAEGVLMVQLLEAGDPRLDGAEGAAHVVARTQVESSDVGGLYVRLFGPTEKLEPGQVVSVNGAGDSFLGALVSALVRTGGQKRVEDLVNYAQTASVLTLKSAESVSPELKTLEL
ncbi:hypothetical protein FH972_023132 [Carpinus fangiana]|uniref:Carbohydrate kinase PfkB domain-containing protein n=1 Tax=Carpinus fangiana TaxID=176857 RepID=A0A5N6KUM6_9ROSI|nr:hypothetical protein FH972_023132 [Carpinus fangiana]